MGRRSGIVGIINAVARDVARAQREAEAARRRAIQDAERQHREALRAQREALRLAAAADRDAKHRYVEAQTEDAAAQTSEIEKRLADLADILAHTLTVDDRIDFDSLRVMEEFPPFRSARELTFGRPEPQLADYVAAVSKPGWISAHLPWIQRRYEAAVREAVARLETDQHEWRAAEAVRLERLVAAKKEYDERRFDAIWKVTQRNAEVAEFQKAYMRGEPRAVIAYNEMVLTRSEYPDGFPQSFRIAYVPESHEIVVDYELPTVAIIPEIAEVRYVKTRDDFEEKPRKRSDIKERYQEVVAAVALRTLHEVFEADQGGHANVVTFSGYVHDVDRATGRDIRPYVISIRATRERFSGIDLARIDLRACLRNLGAHVSPSPEELVPVKPIVEFNMVDRRFVDQSDVLAELDSRPNIMDLTPFEFENLVGNLFSKMGLVTKQTRSVRDGGIDVVAYDNRPILGGKVVIQAKRYRNTVGVSAVRDLYGTMMNEGANKGILVATSGYGTDAYDFAKDKPIELIDGGGLLYLCEQVGVEARIVMPIE